MVKIQDGILRQWGAMEVFNTKENMIFIFEKSAAAWLTREVSYNSTEAKDGGSLNKSMEIAVE